MMGPGRFGDMLNQETLKPRKLSETLGRLGSLLWSFLVHDPAGGRSSSSSATWTQVTTPELTGQATDCFLVPAGASAFGDFASFGAGSGRSLPRRLQAAG